MISRTQRRWTWGLMWRVLLFVLGAILIIGLLYLQQPEDESGSLGSNLLVFSLVNITVLVLLVLIFLVGRNVVKLIFERRQGILGAKLRSRLVGAFLLLLSLPMAASFIVASGLLRDALEGWFSGQVESAVSGSVTVAKQHIAMVKTLGRQSAEGVREWLTSEPALLQRGEKLSRELEEYRRSHALFSIKVVDPAQSLTGHAESPTASVDPFKEPDLDSGVLEQRNIIEPLVRIEERGAAQFIRTYLPWERRWIVTTYRIDPDIVEAQSTVNEAFKEYEQLRMFRHPLKTSYVLTLAMVNLLALFGAIWVAFFIAKQLTVPIQRLAEGTQAVARGNYDFAIRKVRDDEMGFLVQSFNTMIGELKSSRDTAERRKQFIETILRNLAVGVVAVDLSGQITSVNNPASEMLGLPAGAECLSKLIEEVLPESAKETVRSVLEAVRHLPHEARSVERELHVSGSDGKERLLIVTGGRIAGDDESLFGIVLIFDDITEITKAQHHAAWRDVARRIAHEIRNPLTPIQLSAQRLEKLLDGQSVSLAVKESTQTIVEHVSIIKKLANEFSKYARMPTAELVQGQINSLISSVVLQFAEAHPKVAFQCIADSKLGNSFFDPEQIRAVMINLLDNAVGAIEGMPEDFWGAEKPRIVVRTGYDRGSRQVKIDVSDNGPGIPASDRIRVFEPYYTTKKGGTGLGLAIVSSVILDHQGTISVDENTPRGAHFTIVLPEHPVATSQRRLA